MYMNCNILSAAFIYFLNRPALLLNIHVILGQALQVSLLLAIAAASNTWFHK